MAQIGQERSQDHKAESGHKLKLHMKPVELKNGLTTSKWAVRLCLFISVLATGAAVMEWISPTLPPFSGRRAWARELLFTVAGSYGQFLFFLGIAIVSLAAARSFWRHAPRVPGDRWY